MGAEFRRSSMYACMNCLKRSSVDVAAGAVAARAVAAGVVAAGAVAEEAVAEGAVTAGAVAAKAVAVGAVMAGAVAVGAGAEGPGAAGAGAAGAEPGAGEPKSVSEALKPLDSVDFLEPLGADPLDVDGANPLATPWVAAPRTGARQREGAI